MWHENVLQFYEVNGVMFIRSYVVNGANYGHMRYMDIIYYCPMVHALIFCSDCCGPSILCGIRNYRPVVQSEVL